MNSTGKRLTIRTMCRFSLVTLLLVVATGAQAEWTLVATHANGDKTYAESQSLVIVGHLVRLWFKDELHEPALVAGSQVTGFRHLTEFDCTERKFRLLQGTVLKETTDAAANGLDKDSNRRQWLFVEPGTKMAIDFKYACGLAEQDRRPGSADSTQ